MCSARDSATLHENCFCSSLPNTVSPCNLRKYTPQTCALAIAQFKKPQSMPAAIPKDKLAWGFPFPSILCRGKDNVIGSPGNPEVHKPQNDALFFLYLETSSVMLIRCKVFHFHLNRRRMHSIYTGPWRSPRTLLWVWWKLSQRKKLAKHLRRRTTHLMLLPNEFAKDT